MSRIGSIGRSMMIAVSALAAVGCAEEVDGPFELFTWANDYSDGEVEIWVDGERAPGGDPTTSLKSALFESYEEAVEVGVTIETRRDGAVIDGCVLHAGACRGRCRPEREVAGACVSEEGTLSLMEWECPCDDEIAEYSCQYPCTVTAPE